MMILPRTFGEQLKAREHEIEQRIDTLWDELLTALEQGRCTKWQFEYVEAREAEWGDQDVASRWVFSHYLARCVAAPERIGELRDDGRRFPCAQCLEGRGWIEDAERGGWFPCPSCNERQYMLFMDGHYRRDHAPCDVCAPGAHKRGKAGASHYEEVREQRADLEQREIQETLY